MAKRLLGINKRSTHYADLKDLRGPEISCHFSGRSRYPRNPGKIRRGEKRNKVFIFFFVPLGDLAEKGKGSRLYV